MDDYPSSYVEHNLPLIFVSGIRSDDSPSTEAYSQDTTSRLVGQFPLCKSDCSVLFLRHLRNRDGSQQWWNGASLPASAGNMMYKIKVVTRDLALPPRKAAPIAMPASFEPVHGAQAQSTPLHSPLSPLSPGSSVFADGILSPLWFQKHQDHVPSLFMACFDLVQNGRLEDVDRISSEINNLRNAFARSGHKTRLVAIFMSDRGIQQLPDIEQSLTDIRRATSLDAKTDLFFMPPIGSDGEMATFVQALMTTLQPVCVDYYRDLTKHARRKKQKNGASSSTPTSATAGVQVLSASGWNVRYDVKQGVFAEFRQEMDVAERHYSSAIEEMFRDDGVLETTPSWAPRWDQARLLCDMLALRIIRCLLWMSLTTGAAESWANYQARMKDLIDRRSKGSETYAWAAWESRWAHIMAELVHRAQPMAFQVPAEDHSEKTWMAAWSKPERLVDRILPFHLLHSTPFWLMMAVAKVRVRHQRALLIPLEDRSPPSRVPASTAASRNRNYDLYLALQPHEEAPLPDQKGYDYIEDIETLTKQTVHSLRQHGQDRLAEFVQFNFCKDLLDADRQAQALVLLKALWQRTTWRKDGWQDLFSHLLRSTHACARAQRDIETVLTTSWELTASTSDDVVHIDMPSCLNGLGTLTDTTQVIIEHDHLNGPIQPWLVFQEQECRLGDPLRCQIGILSRVLPGRPTLLLSCVEVFLTDGRTITIKHRQSEHLSNKTVTFDEVQTEFAASGDTFEITSDLRIMPGQRRIVQVQLQARDAGILSVDNISVTVKGDNFVLSHRLRADQLLEAVSFHVEKGPEPYPRSLIRLGTIRTRILPKPSKVEIVLLNDVPRYFTNEHIGMAITLINNEDEEISGEMHGEIVTTIGEKLPLQWAGATKEESDISLLMSPGEEKQCRLWFLGATQSCTASLQLNLHYNLQSTPGTLILKEQARALEFLDPFLCRFEFAPQFQEGAWPDYFNMDLDRANDVDEGVLQRWLVKSSVSSDIVQALIIDGTTISVVDTPEDISLTLLSPLSSSKVETITKGDSLHKEFFFTTQKYSLDDRRPSMLQLQLEIKWRREGEATQSTSIIPIPRLTLPSSEPRVLLTLDKEVVDPDVRLIYHLENPSLHFLTFVLTMEPNENFDHFEPSQQQLSLGPLSRYEARFDVRLRPEEGTPADAPRLVRPVLTVLDSYYQKTLRVHAGGPGVRHDEHGILVEVT